LPQPEPIAQSKDSAELDDTPDEDDVGASREPRVRGRAPIFEHGQRSIASLMSDIERDVIALPDLQRPFVWEDTKVRELLDSLFVGFVRALDDAMSETITVDYWTHSLVSALETQKARAPAALAFRAAQVVLGADSGECGQ